MILEVNNRLDKQTSDNQKARIIYSTQSKYLPFKLLNDFFRGFK